tara:strand:- start:2532 stop:3041 length:510 start_codon:yes stop_codon:yes gene_type:complete
MYQTQNCSGTGSDGYCMEAMMMGQTMSQQECSSAGYMWHNLFDDMEMTMIITINSDNTGTTQGDPFCEDNIDEESQNECISGGYTWDDMHQECDVPNYTESTCLNSGYIWDEGGPNAFNWTLNENTYTLTPIDENAIEQVVSTITLDGTSLKKQMITDMGCMEMILTSE